MSKYKYTLQELDVARQFIELEGVSEFYTNSKALTKFTDMAKSTVEFVKNKMSGIAAYFSNKEHYFEVYRQFAKDTIYGDVTRLQLQVPEGFKGNLVDYTEALLEANEICSNVLNDLITPFNVYVSSLINNPALLASITFTHKVKVKDVSKVIKGLAKFNDGKKHTLLDLGKVYGRNKDIEAQASLLETLYKIHSNGAMDKLAEGVKALDANLLALVELLESPNSNTGQISPKTMTTLANLSYDLAQHVEMVAVVNHMTSVLIYASQVNEDTFKAHLKG